MELAPVWSRSSLQRGDPLFYARPASAVQPLARKGAGCLPEVILELLWTRQAIAKLLNTSLTLPKASVYLPYHLLPYQRPAFSEAPKALSWYYSADGV